MSERFQWPNWLSLSEICFDFTNKEADSVRETAFKELLEIKNSPHSMSQKDKDCLIDQYKTLLMNAKEEMKQSPSKTAEAVIYKICTKESSYHHIKPLLAYVMRWLSISFNECVVEALFSQILDTDDVGKPFALETVDNICYIRHNGPHPLVAKPLVRAALDQHFGKNKDKSWHFITSSNKFFTSKSHTTEMKEGKEKFSLFD